LTGGRSVGGWSICHRARRCLNIVNPLPFANQST
jgi:hypothetical protein